MNYNHGYKNIYSTRRNNFVTSKIFLQLSYMKGILLVDVIEKFLLSLIPRICSYNSREIYFLNSFELILCVFDFE